MKKEGVDVIIAIGEKLIDGPVGKFLCGEYDDGSVRSIPDAIRGENMSPSQKKKHKKKKKGQKKAMEVYMAQYSSSGKKKGKKKKKNKTPEVHSLLY